MKFIRKKILSLASLVRRLKKAKARRKKIVFTNGVFDLLHVGHLRVFSKSKRLGHILVVGINSDASVRKIKGKNRPLYSQKDRAALVEALEPVDYVVIFGETTPNRILKEIRPDILVKGGDYQVSEIVGREWAKKVVRIPLVKGLSSTNIIKRILKTYGPSKRKKTRS